MDGVTRFLPLALRIHDLAVDVEAGGCAVF